MSTDPSQFMTPHARSITRQDKIKLSFGRALLSAFLLTAGCSSVGGALASATSGDMTAGGGGTGIGGSTAGSFGDGAGGRGGSPTSGQGGQSGGQAGMNVPDAGSTGSVPEAGRDTSPTCPTIVFTGSGPTLRHGGQNFTPTEPPYRDLCPNGGPVIGYTGFVDTNFRGLSISVIGRIAPICGRVEVGPSASSCEVSVSKGTTLPLRGKAGDVPFTQLCPPNQVVVAFGGRAGDAIDQIGFTCAPLQIASGQAGYQLTIGTTTALAPAGGNGGSAFRDACPVGQVAQGQDLDGMSGYLVSFALDCTTPTLVPSDTSVSDAGRIGDIPDAAGDACPKIVLMGDTPTLRHGLDRPRPPTLPAFRDSCPDGGPVIGYTGSIYTYDVPGGGAFIGQIAAICGNLEVKPSAGSCELSISKRTTLPLRGPPLPLSGPPLAGRPFTQLCPPNQVITAFRGQIPCAAFFDRSEVTQLAFSCAPLHLVASAVTGYGLSIGMKTELAPAGGDGANGCDLTGGGAFVDGCPMGQIARSQDIGQSDPSQPVSSFALNCSTPTLVP